MSNTTINTCSGTFYDSGGSGGSYSSSENYTMTICSDASGAAVEVSFSSFNLESTYDNLEVYEGVGTGTLMDSGSGGDFAGQSFTSSQASGCLTFVFSSDGSVTYDGWEATISCTFPCQAFDANIVSVSEPYSSGDTIDVCQNASITFDAAGNYPNNNIDYNQTDANTTFTWDFGDGTTATGQSVTHTFSDGGGYYVTLEALDLAGCDNQNYEVNMVRVSTDPTFVGTSIAEDTICAGEIIHLSGFTQTEPWAISVPPPWAGQTHFDDAHYQEIQSASITYEIFNQGQTLDDINDLLNVCVEME
ncbi:MAG: hypothetical protein C0594_00420, partial [Marinilabiliales bacterium]